MKRTAIVGIVLVLMLVLPASASAKTQLYDKNKKRTDGDIIALEFSVVSKKGKLKYVEDMRVAAKHGPCENGAPESDWSWFSRPEERSNIDRSDDNSFQFQTRGFGESYKFQGEIRDNGLAVGKFRGGYGYGSSAGDHNCNTNGALPWGAKPVKDEG
jgi:hypothetical protein